MFTLLRLLDGTLHRVRQEDGQVEWQEAKNATSSPVVWEGECYFSLRQEMPEGDAAKGGVYQSEYLAARTLKEAHFRSYGGTARPADYLDHGKRMRGSPRYAASSHKDMNVGFGYAKGDAKMAQAMANLGTAHVHGVWA